MSERRPAYLVLATALLLAGCEGQLDGTWEEATGDLSYEFRPDGRVWIRALGSVVVGDYTLHGDRVVLTSPQGTVVLERRGDELSGPMGARFTRRSE